MSGCPLFFSPWLCLDIANLLSVCRYFSAPWLCLDVTIIMSACPLFCSFLTQPWFNKRNVSLAFLLQPLDAANMKELNTALQGFLTKGQVLQLETKVTTHSERKRIKNITSGVKNLKFSLVLQSSTSKFLLVLLQNNAGHSRKYNLALYFCTCVLDIGWNYLLVQIEILLVQAQGQLFEFYPCNIMQILQIFVH